MKTFLKSFVYAGRGVVRSFSERALKTHLVVATVAVILGFYFGITKMEWAILVFAIATVIGFEIVNTAIEYLVNIVRDEARVPYEKIGYPKDLAAGAVLVVSIGALIVGLIIFLPYVF